MPPDELDAQIAVLRERTERLDRVVSELYTRASDLDRRTAALAARLENVTTALERTQEAIEKLQKMMHQQLWAGFMLFASVLLSAILQALGVF